MTQEDKSITRKNLPDGFYQIVILGATVHDNKSGKGVHLRIAYDIVAPKEFRLHFDSEYKAQKSEDKKYHGFTYICVPFNGDQYSNTDIARKYKEFIHALEVSNPTYQYEEASDKCFDLMRGLRLFVYIENETTVCTNNQNYKQPKIKRFYEPFKLNEGRWN